MKYKITQNIEIQNKNDIFLSNW